MRKNLSKIILSVAMALGLSLNSVGLAAGTIPQKPPSWVTTVEGDSRPVPQEPEAAQDPVKTEEAEKLEAWKEQRASLKVPVLLYHHITEEDIVQENAVSLISPQDFRLHMTAIKVNFTPISLRHYLNYLDCEDGSVTMPENPIIVTFDDGYTSNYEIAYPILKELEIPATIFVVTDTVGEQAGGGKVNHSHFTWEQAKEMESSGLIEIQSHSASHVPMAEQSFDQLVLQMRKSKYLVEKNMGHPCDMFAYPYGSYSDATIEAARRAGYHMQLLVGDATTDLDFEVNLPSEGRESITRITIAGTMGNVNVIETIRTAMAKKVVPADQQ